jgi:hypothetical protein
MLTEQSREVELSARLSTVPVGQLRKARLQGQGVCDAVKRGCKLIGLDPNLYGGHSLRSGFVTCSLDSGEEIAQVMVRTRHKSIAVLLGYHRPKNFSHNPLGKTTL